MPTLNLDPVTLLLIAVIVVGIVVLVLRARSLRPLRAEEQYPTLIFNGQTYILPARAYHELIDQILPEGQRQVARVQRRLLRGKPVSERDVLNADQFVADALRRLLFDKPGYTVLFTEHGVADLRRRTGR